ncbi:CHAP domain-containing protein [Aquimarina sp. AU474]|uniref:CHAP domain-containing protein n=1 Tax=Aquimarina sp. AU474 TaxID=2108529 RepID=UPI000D69FA48|nr:CHAP domain-containing protein [Aquimarina sp. AU474]
MAKISFIVISILFLHFNFGYAIQSTCVKETYDDEIGVREATGNNDGKDVEKYLKSVDLGKGNAWCAAFVHWVFEQCGVENSINAWSPTAENKKNFVWNKKQWYKKPKSGDVFCLYYSSKRRIGHTGFFDLMINSKIYQTVEGNTDATGGSEGDGVYRRKRSINSTYSISRWLKN